MIAHIRYDGSIRVCCKSREGEFAVTPCRIASPKLFDVYVCTYQRLFVRIVDDNTSDTCRLCLYGGRQYDESSHCGNCSDCCVHILYIHIITLFIFKRY